jgi:hypothetical protein
VAAVGVGAAGVSPVAGEVGVASSVVRQAARALKRRSKRTKRVTFGVNIFTL